jgi:hypothetical protein
MAEFQKVYWDVWRQRNDFREAEFYAREEIKQLKSEKLESMGKFTVAEIPAFNPKPVKITKTDKDAINPKLATVINATEVESKNVEEVRYTHIEQRKQPKPVTIMVRQDYIKPIVDTKTRVEIRPIDTKPIVDSKPCTPTEGGTKATDEIKTYVGCKPIEVLQVIKPANRKPFKLRNTPNQKGMKPPL